MYILPHSHTNEAERKPVLGFTKGETRYARDTPGTGKQGFEGPEPGFSVSQTLKPPQTFWNSPVESKLKKGPPAALPSLFPTPPVWQRD